MKVMSLKRNLHQFKMILQLEKVPLFFELIASFDVFDRK